MNLTEEIKRRISSSLDKIKIEILKHRRKQFRGAVVELIFLAIKDEGYQKIGREGDIKKCFDYKGISLLSLG